MEASSKKAWNKGKRVGPKRKLDRESISLLRSLLRRSNLVLDLALFEVALSTMLRASDVLNLRVRDLALDSEAGITSQAGIAEEARVVMRKTGRSIRVIIADKAAAAVFELIVKHDLQPDDYLFSVTETETGRRPMALMTYSRYIKRWCGLIGLPKEAFSTHSMRRTRAALYYEETGDIRAVQLMLGHSNISATQRYLGVEEDDAIERFRKVDI